MCAKMSQLHAELSEQANELGFESLDEALTNGYEVDYEEKQLVNPYVLVDKAQEEAHEAWLKERDEVLGGLESCLETSECSPACDIDIERAIKFIKEQCHD